MCYQWRVVYFTSSLELHRVTVSARSLSEIQTDLWQRGIYEMQIVKIEKMEQEHGYVGGPG